MRQILEENHPLRLLADSSPKGTPSLTAQALGPVASLLPHALQSSKSLDPPKHDTELDWAEWVLQARPEIAPSDDPAALESECLLPGMARVSSDPPGGYLAVWISDGGQTRWEYTHDSGEAERLANSNRGLPIPLWPREHYRFVRQETKSFLEAVKSWRSGRRIHDKGGLRRVGGIEAMSAMRGGFLHHGKPLLTSEIRTPSDLRKAVQYVPDDDLKKMLERAVGSAPKTLIAWELERRETHGRTKLRPPGKSETWQCRMWRLWLRAGHGAPGLCWWDWKATATLLNVRCDPTGNYIAKMGERLGLLKVSFPIVRDCVVDGDRLTLTMRLTVDRRGKNPEEVYIEVPASAYR